MASELAGETIVHVVTTVQHGGAERVVLELASRQRALGADVKVICLQQLGDLLPLFERAGIPVALVAGSGTPGALRMAWRLGGALRSAGATVVHTHNSAPQVTAGLGQQLRRWRRQGTVLVHTEHGRLGDVRPALLRWRRWTVSEFDAVFAVSLDAQAQLLEHGIRSASGVDVVLNGIDVSRFPRRDAAHPAGTHVVHVGRLDRIKGQDVLMTAIPRVREGVPTARFTIVGDGPMRGELEQQANRLGLTDVVKFVGATDDVRPYLESADLFVLPSRSEGISLALLEAMASGLAVVATDVGGNREVISSAATGTLVAAEQPAELAAAIVDLLRQPGAARAAGMAGRELVERRFSSATTAQVYAGHYRRLRAAGSGRITRSAA